jgi:hypothetical protein
MSGLQPFGSPKMTTPYMNASDVKINSRYSTTSALTVAVTESRGLTGKTVTDEPINSSLFDSIS